MPWPLKTCTLLRVPKPLLFIISRACYLKTFWQPCLLWFIDKIRPFIFALNPKSRQKYFNYTQSQSKIWAQKIDESIIHCNCRIPKSVKISLWMRNPGKNIFKIRGSVHQFTPMFRYKWRYSQSISCKRLWFKCCIHS